MNSSEEEQYKEKLLKIYERVARIRVQFPEADPQTLVQSFLMESQTPLEKLNFALMRARGAMKKNAH